MSILEDIRKAKQQLKGLYFLDSPTSFAGVRLIANPMLPEFEPRQRLSPHVAVSPEFRREMDQWLEDYFGTQRAFYFIDKNVAAAHPETIQALKAGVSEWRSPL